MKLDVVTACRQKKMFIWHLSFYLILFIHFVNLYKCLVESDPYFPSSLFYCTSCDPGRIPAICISHSISQLIAKTLPAMSAHNTTQPFLLIFYSHHFSMPDTKSMTK